MFSFFKKKPGIAGTFEGLSCDMHSHLIPGIDDGVQDMTHALGLIRGLEDLGYKKLITTPHSNGHSYRNTPAIITTGRDSVKEELRREGVGLEFQAAAEYLLDDAFTDNLAAKADFLTLKDNLILVELSFVVPAMNLKQLLFDLQLKGFQPVLAHPERYVYFAGNKSWYDQLHDSCLFQLNLLSFSSHYGPEVRDLANYLVKKRYVDYLGTDLHHPGHLELLRTSSSVHKAVHQLLDTGLLRNSLL